LDSEASVRYTPLPTGFPRFEYGFDSTTTKHVFPDTAAEPIGADAWVAAVNARARVTVRIVAESLRIPVM
jgi:hypothetical protein